MMYEVRLINPRTAEERKVVVFADRALAEASPCWQSYVQGTAWPDIPPGFMPIGNGVRPVTKQ
jgi:hypothetical protein